MLCTLYCERLLEVAPRIIFPKQAEELFRTESNIDSVVKGLLCDNVFFIIVSPCFV